MKTFKHFLQINELKKTTLASYVKGAMADRELSATSSSFKSGAAGDKYNKADETPREVKRAKGIDTALNKLTREETLDEDGGAAGGAMGVAAVAGSGDSRLPVSQREPGVSKKRNPTLGSIRRRNLPQV
jgi:hypothetical protein